MPTFDSHQAEKFAYNNWTLEMPLWLAAFLFIGLVFLSVFLLWFFYVVFTSSSRLKSLWVKHRAKNARIQLAQGLLELNEGHYKKAELYLTNSAPYSDVPVIHYLSAAKAADEINAPDRRDKYLQLAHNVSRGSDIAVRLAEAQFFYNHGDLEQSVAILQHLHAEHPKHTQVLKLLASLYNSMKDWDSLYSLLPELKKANIYNEAEIHRIESTIYSHLLPDISRKGKKPLEQFWRSASRTVQDNPECIIIYCECLIKHQAEIAAEQVLKNKLSTEYSPELMKLYSKIFFNSSDKQIIFAENLLPGRSDDDVLLLSLGRLCMQQKLWGKARDYLEKSLDIYPSAEAYALLGQLMEQMGYPEKSQVYFREGLLQFSESKV